MKNGILSRTTSKALFRVRSGLETAIRMCRKISLQLQGVSIGTETLPGRLTVNWPHQLSIGSGCILEDDLIFKFDGIYASGPSILIGNNVFLGNHCEFNICQGITLSDHCLIASGCKFIDHDHSMDPGRPIGATQGPEAKIFLGPNVWLGVNVVVLKG
ncbi:MAG: acyltransferase, partial [Verrucomicrobiota bacterium]